MLIVQFMFLLVTVDFIASLPWNSLLKIKIASQYSLHIGKSCFTGVIENNCYEKFCRSHRKKYVMVICLRWRYIYVSFAKIFGAVFSWNTSVKFSERFFYGTTSVICRCNQLTFTCSNSRIKALEKGEKFVQS